MNELSVTFFLIKIENTHKLKKSFPPDFPPTRGIKGGLLWQ
jgi:hypothetical protein